MFAIHGKRMTGLLLLGGALFLAGCGTSKPQAAPNVHGQRLDVAERHLDDRGLDYEEVGGGAFGVVVRSNWWVCAQEPRPGKKTTHVRLIVARDCSLAPDGVPSVTGRNLEDAEDQLEAAGYRFRIWNVDDDEIVVRHFWRVCDEWVDADDSSTVELWVAHLHCDEDD
jgi:hypothetical protein